MKEKTLLEAARQILLGEQENNNVPTQQQINAYRKIVAPLYAVINKGLGTRISSEDDYNKALLKDELRDLVHSISEEIQHLQKLPIYSKLKYFPDIKIILEFSKAMLKKDAEKAASFFRAFREISREGRHAFAFIEQSKYISKEVKDYIMGYKKYFTPDILDDAHRNWHKEEKYAK